MINNDELDEIKKRVVRMIDLAYNRDIRQSLKPSHYCPHPISQEWMQSKTNQWKKDRETASQAIDLLKRVRDEK